MFRSQPRHIQKSKRGIASFEMVVFLPSLIVLSLILLFYCGFGIQTSVAIVEARQEAWAKRYVDDSEREWEVRPFLMGGGEDESQYAQGEVERKVKTVKLFNNWAVPRSEHLVLAGTWDKEDDLLDASPNIQSTFQVARAYAQSVYAKAKGDVQQLESIMNSLQSPNEFIQQMGRQVMESAMQEVTSSIPSILLQFL